MNSVKIFAYKNSKRFIPGRDLFLEIHGKEVSWTTSQSCGRRRNIKGVHRSRHELNCKEPRQTDALNPFNPSSGHR